MAREVRVHHHHSLQIGSDGAREELQPRMRDAAFSTAYPPASIGRPRGGLAIRNSTPALLL